MITLLSTQPLVSDPTWIFFLVLLIILLSPLLLRKLHVPHIIGLILAGVVVGQHGLNLLARDSSFELFGQVGIYYIMFLAGLELDMGSVARYGRQGVRFGLLTFAVPFVLGYLSAAYILGLGVGASLLLACLFSSHTLVAYPLVGHYGMGRHRTVVVAVLATAITTFAALVALALVVGSRRPEADVWYWVRFAALCVAYFALSARAVPRLGRWFLRRYDDSVMQYIFVLAMVFLLAALASLVGLEGLLGAFVAGLVASRMVPRTSPLMTRIEFVGNALFIPYFLIGVGMLIDVRVLFGDAHTLWVVAVMVVTATASKWLAAVLDTLPLRPKALFLNPNVLLKFGLTNAHAAGALAIVMIGTEPEVGLMDATLLNGTVMLIFFSCIISSLATTAGARALTLESATPEENRGAYHGKCLVTYSREQTVDDMTELAILIRNPWITDSLMGLVVELEEETDSVGRPLLARAQQTCAAADVAMTTMSRVSTNAASGILHTMRENEVGEVIVSLADRRTDMPKASLGTVIDNILAGSHREVMAVRAIVPPGTWRQVVVVAHERAEYEVGFFKWVEHVCRIGEQLDCRLHFHVHRQTAPHISRYMREKHPGVRHEVTELNHWSQFHALAPELGRDHLFVVVSARPGFISYAPALSSLPQQIATHFAHTSVMLLYPDQWGEPSEAVSIFAPNGQAVRK